MAGGKAAGGDILELLQTIRRGEFLLRINEQLSELTQACFITEGDGEIEIKLAFKNNAEGQVRVVPKVKIKKPIRAVGEAIYYATVDGSLERDDPKQRNMFDDEPTGGGHKN